MRYDNFSLRHIARHLDPSNSTIARDINRSETCQKHQAHAAHGFALSVTLVRHLPSRKAATVSAAISQMLRPYKAQCWMLTFYNGKEFAEHVFFDNCLQPEVVFAHPYNLWKRAPTRTRTGWCQFFSKAMSFTYSSDIDVDKVACKVNHRPRKSLGFRTPHEFFFDLLMRQLNQTLFHLMLESKTGKN